jgi:hydroxyacylglutathione hydrolase
MTTHLSDSIIPIRALNDNYIWTLLDKANKTAFVIDPGEANPVIDRLEELEHTLSGILLTHHHSDHSGGIVALLDYAGSIPVIASHRSKIQSINQRVRESDEINFADFHLKVMEIPGHTLDHIAFYIDSQVLFSGDTLFSSGCGRIFEGTPPVMFDSLNKLLSLNDTTKVYCGHEYTLTNSRFAYDVEPTNQRIAEKIAMAKKIGAQQGGCTLPSTIAVEKETNPFLRCHVREVIQAAEKFSGKKPASALDVFTSIRQWKNEWK